MVAISPGEMNTNIPWGHVPVSSVLCRSALTLEISVPSLQEQKITLLHFL